MSLNPIRTLISGPKARFKDDSTGDSVNLDLVYATDQVILMGYPATGIASLYRNRRDHVRDFLDSRHGSNYRIFNLCPSTENAYSPDIFHGQVSRYPFPDHHPCPLELLKVATREMKNWLDASKEHVAVIHCKAGKGRTGTLLCSYLLLLPEPPSPPTKDQYYSKSKRSSLASHRDPDSAREDGGALSAASSIADGTTDEENADPDPAIPSEEVILVSNPPLPESYFSPFNDIQQRVKPIFTFHTSRRMRKPSLSHPGVSIPSQRRWVRYFATILSHDEEAVAEARRRTKIKVVAVEVTLKGHEKGIRGVASRYVDSYVRLLRDEIKQQQKEGPDWKGSIEEVEKLEKAKGGLIQSLALLPQASITPTSKEDENVHVLIPQEDLVLNENREIKIQLIAGSSDSRTAGGKIPEILTPLAPKALLSSASLGWVWIIPSFHLPSKPPKALNGEKQRHTLSFHPKIVDFRSSSLVSLKVVWEEVDEAVASETKVDMSAKEDECKDDAGKINEGDEKEMFRKGV